MMLTRSMSRIACFLFLLACLGACAQPTLAPAPSQTAVDPTAVYTATSAPTLTPTPEPCLTIPGQNPCSMDVEVPVSSSSTYTARIHFLLYLPGDYGKEPQKKWPLLLFLHGSGSIGSDLDMLRRSALVNTLETQTDFPFMVISPQLPAYAPASSDAAFTQIQYWSPLIDPLNVLIDRFIASYPIDTRRIYLTGLSLGGFGTWDFALRYPKRFSAIVPVAGGYLFQSDAIPAGICDLANLPVWVFHGGKDTNVLPVQAQSMVKALQDCGGGKVRFTFYEDADHSLSFNRAYADPELWQWLLQQTK
jgi:predicted peptidase